jgi:hypothetical protein
MTEAIRDQPSVTENAGPPGADSDKAPLCSARRRLPLRYFHYSKETVTQT